MKKLSIIGASVFLAMSVTAQAADNTGAGCGLGAEVLEGKSGKGSNIAAAILNAIAVPNTFFMTTGGGLMGCDPTQTVENEQAKEIFVASNMDQLSSEVARGDGEYLNVLATLMGVEDQDMTSFRKLAQQNYDALFATDAKGVITSMELAMLSDSTLSKYATN